jgi:DNA invertase Pin-like site-specific DNA recombinase
MKEGNGLDSQEHRCREYAQFKAYEVEAVFKDSFSGGGDFMKRPAMSELLRYLDSHSHKQYVVIFDDLKRFARDKRFHWDLRAAFKSRNTPIECLNFKFEETPEGEFVEAIFAAQGELEREQNKRQVIQKQKARLESGYWPFFPPPGYTQSSHHLHKKLLIPNERAPLIKEAFEGFASGRFREQIDVQHFLQEQKFLGNKPVYLEFVKRLLSRVIYAGYIEFPQWEVSRRRGHHEAIISIEIFERVQEKIKGRTFKRTIRNEDFPLRGLIVCSKCGRKMTAGWNKGRSNRYPNYKCQRIWCKEKEVRRERIEGDFLRVLSTIKPKQGIIALAKQMIVEVWQKKVKNFGDIVEGYRKQRQELIRNRDQLVDKILLTQSPAVIKAIEEKIESIEVDIKKVDQLIENSNNIHQDYGTAVEIILGLLENPAFVWENGDYNKKQLITKLVFVENPVYDREVGYGTANLSIGIRLFEIICTQKAHDVEMAGIEPACKRCS